MSSLAQEITEKLPWLVDELGFRITSEDYSPKSFGDSLVILDGSHFRLRLVRDRGQIFAYLATRQNPEEWRSLNFVLETINDRISAPDFTLEGIGMSLRENLDVITEALDHPWTKGDLLPGTS